MSDHEQKLWGEAGVTASAPAGVTVQSSANGPQLALAFSGARLELPAEAGPDGATQSFTVRAPLGWKGHRRLAGFVQDITLGLQKSSGARVVVVADLAGVSRTFEFDYAAPGAAPVSEPLRVERVFSAQGVETSGAGLIGLPRPVADYQAAFLVTVQRRGPQESALVSIDGLDVAACLV